MNLRGGKNIIRHRYNIAVTNHAVERLRQRFPFKCDRYCECEYIKQAFVKGDAQKQDSKYLNVVFEDMILVSAYPDDKFIVVTVMRRV